MKDRLVCGKCGKPKFGAWSTICSAEIGKINELYCQCSETFTMPTAPSSGLSAEQFLAKEGFADSVAHSSVAIAELMDRYAALKVQEAENVNEKLLAELGKYPLREAVVRALEDDRYDWRTLGGIARATGAKNPEILSLLNSMSDQIVRTTAADGQALFTTRNHYEQTHGFGDKLLSALADKVVA